MAVPRPNIRWRGAHPNNFTVGRPGGGLDGRETEHHVVGSRESAVVVFNQPTRGASSHFVVGGDIIDQCVDIANTAWCDGNWESNIRSITIEHEGGWNGDSPYSDAMYEQAAHLTAWLRENYGVNRYQRHRDVSLTGTACPGGLDCERIWNRATQLIQEYSAPPPDTRPEWQKNLKQIPERTIFALPKEGGTFVYNLNNLQPSDSRRFPTNQNFLIKGETSVAGQKYYITRSSFDSTTANGLLATEMSDTMWVAPAPTPTPPPVPSTPTWIDAMVDTPNREMYILRATPLIDLEYGKPYQDKTGKEVWYQAGDIVKDVSAYTVVSDVTYQVTEYGFKEFQGQRYQNCNGIKSADMTVDPAACPPGTPANPKPLPAPEDPPANMPDVPPADPDGNAVIAFLLSLVKLITDFLGKFKRS
jgi:hypothetical protein